MFVNQFRGTLGRKVPMDTRDNLDFFYGNLLMLMREAGLSKRQLSLQISDSETFIDDVVSKRVSPNIEAIYAIATALRVDVADLLRPGPQFGVSGGSRQNYWVERTAEEYLASALSKSRDSAAHEAPTFDAVLNWWHNNEGLLSSLDSFEQYIEIFQKPDENEMRPRPYRLGQESLASRELGLTGPEQLQKVFDSSSPEVAEAVAMAHLDVAGGQPQLSVHTILFNLSTGSFVELIYNRLLLPVTDGDGQKYIMNYSKPVRRSEIGREQIHEFEARHGGKPVLSRLI